MQIRNQIIKKLNKLEQLPAFPSIVHKIITEINNQDASASDIAKLIELEPSYFLAILKIANSTFYNRSGANIGNIQQAIARLGINETKKICLAMSIMKMFIRTSGLINLRDFWKHSIGTAMSTRIFANIACMSTNEQNDAYTAGLFHNIGILIFDQFFLKEYKEIYQNDTMDELPIHKKKKKEYLA